MCSVAYLDSRNQTSALITFFCTKPTQRSGLVTETIAVFVTPVVRFLLVYSL